MAAKLADRCEIQISYAIGIAKPVSININTFNTNKIPEEKIFKIIKRNFDLRPKHIIDSLELLNPIYEKTSVYGHFGRSDVIFPWEKTDVAKNLKQ